MFFPPSVSRLEVQPSRQTGSPGVADAVFPFPTLRILPAVCAAASPTPHDYFTSSLSSGFPRSQPRVSPRLQEAGVRVLTGITDESRTSGTRSAGGS